MATNREREEGSVEIEATPAPDEPARPFVFDVRAMPGRSNAELLGGSEESEALFDLLGRDLVSRTLVQTDKLSMYHVAAQPGEAVKPHRHGTYQASYILRGELVFGSRRVGPGMGYFSPDKLYAWRAGDEGAEWIEVHAGPVGIFTDPSDDDNDNNDGA